MSGQSVIPLGGMEDRNLEQFVTGDNAELICLLRSLVQAPEMPPRLVYIWGEPGSGKSHLLQGLVAMARQIPRPAQFCSLDSMDLNSRQPHHHVSHPDAADTPFAETIVSGSLLCADNLSRHTLTDSGAVSLLGIYEAAMARDAQLVLAATEPPEHLAAALPDLASRLASGARYRLTALDESDKRRALQLRARFRGFELEDNVIEFIMRHFARDTASLFALLDRIDGASLAQQRRVTIPLVRELLAGGR